MSRDRGSQWNKWDLHVHTPASFHQNYGGNTQEAWEHYIDNLESLPSEFKVIGVNDYYSVEGYKKLVEAKARGRLSNIDLLLPVIELRLDKFAGTAGKLNKVNYHIVFSDQLPPEGIENRFLRALTNEFKLTSIYDNELDLKWMSSFSHDAIVELGKKIKASVQKEKIKDFRSDVHEGYSNLVISHKAVVDVLTKNDFFEGKYIIGIGKTEWDELAWNDQSIADKKNVINTAHVVFTAAESFEKFHKGQVKLTEAGVNHFLLDCSDAHNYMSSQDKDRIGNCFTWIKGETTFEGLKHALLEYEDRVFIGELPEKLVVYKENKTKFIDNLEFNKINSSFEEDWFDKARIPFSNDLVAVIGNKGTGKSALTDTIALLSNSRNHAKASFLNENRFCMLRENKAKNFNATITWASGLQTTKFLSDLTDPTGVELVKYIPQGFFEEVCNEVPGGEEKAFDKELKQVIFSHVGEDDRLGRTNLDDLINTKVQEIDDSRQIVYRRLKRINQEISELEEKVSKESIETLDNTLKQKEEEYASFLTTKPTEPIRSPSGSDYKQAALSDEIEELKLKRNEIELKVQEIRESLKTEKVKLSDTRVLIGKYRNLDTQIRDALSEVVPILNNLAINTTEIFQYSLNLSPLTMLENELVSKIELLESQIDESNLDSEITKLNDANRVLNDLQDKLDEPSRNWERYLNSITEWENRCRELEGSISTPGTLVYYRNEKANLKNLPIKLANLRLDRESILIEIYDHVVQKANVYKLFYKPVQEFIEGQDVAKTKLDLHFNVSIVNSNFEVGFFDFISQNKIGSFYGRDEGTRNLDRILSSYNLNDKDDVVCLVNELMKNLHTDIKDAKRTNLTISSQLKSGKTKLDLYNFIFSLEFLEPRYVLRVGGKDLHQLSPGERGTILLIFYLLIDKDIKPLIIDQPEGNLDSETVYKQLVQAIKLGKRKRQLILVTHNPNLAVVCGAEQVIVCSIDKTNRNRVTYESGAIENKQINDSIVNILEGTLPAFDYRKWQYQPDLKLY